MISVGNYGLILTDLELMNSAISSNYSLSKTINLKT